MFELAALSSDPVRERELAFPARVRPSPRPAASSLLAGLLAQALDEVDFGVVLLDDTCHVLHANHAASLELQGEHPMVLVDGQLCLRLVADQRQLKDAVAAASRRGLRRLLTLGDDRLKARVSVVPLRTAGAKSGGLPVMLALAKAQVCANLTVQGFARAHRLSAGEEQVLEALCRGELPNDIAGRHGVAISTVRTQIANIRTKTGASSIRALVQQVSVLPPLVGALRLGDAVPGAVRASGPLFPAAMVLND